MLRRTALALLLALPLAGVAQAPSPLELSLQRGDDGPRLSYSARLELPRAADDALHKGVPLYFVAEAQISRDRWYWRDAVVARGKRQWRLSYQPLSRQYRLSTGGLHQGYDSLAEALAVVGRSGGWPLELREPPEADARYRLNFRLRLDNTQLPAPLQIGLGSSAQLDLQRELPLAADVLLPPPPATP